MQSLALPEIVPSRQPPVTVSRRSFLPEGRSLVLLVVLLLIGAGWTAYQAVTGFGFIPFDDPSYVYENQSLRHGLTWPGVHWAFTSIEKANWHPLTWLSLMADYQVYGLNAGGYHLTNLLLHEAATVSLFLWLLLATRRIWPSASAALLFCIHPAHVESVAWVTERKDVLSTLFFFLTLLAYTGYTRTGKRVYYASAVGTLVLGLLAKPMLVTVPPLLLLLDAWPLGRWRAWRELPRLVLEKTPFILLAAASCVVTFIAQRAGGATVAMDTLPPWWRFGGGVTGYAAYLGELFWPVNLGVYYPYWDTMPGWRVAACLAGLGAITAWAALCYRARPYLLVGWLWFLGTLVPVIGFVQVGTQSMADRYTYQPYVGLFIALCWGVAECRERWPAGRRGLTAVSTAVLAACLTLCIRQVGYWHSGATLVRHTLDVTRPNTLMSTLLGDALTLEHRYQEAETAYRGVFHTDQDLGELSMRLGYMHLEQGHWAEAAQYLRTAVEQPDCKDPVLFCNLGFVLLRIHRNDEAITMLQRSLRLRPAYANAHGTLADALLAAGNTAGAIEAYEKALMLNPDIPATLAKLSWLYSFEERGANPQHAARALVLARRAANFANGRYVPGLDSLAAALAANGDWSAAANVARSTLPIIGTRPAEFAPEDKLLHEARVKAYLAKQWPPE